MRKFIRVTGKLSGKVYLQNIDSIEVYSDNEIQLKRGDRFDVEESIEQIEAQLLRDEFAKAALTGLIGDANISIENAAEIAYRTADAMLKERTK